MKLFGLIGEKLGHSLSPEIHNKVFKDNNIDGFLVDYKNAKEMAQVVNKLIKDKELRSYITTNAEKKVKEQFNVNRYVDEISCILDRFK